MNKRRFSKATVLSAYDEDGIHGIIKLIGKTEICFFDDDFSEKVITLVNEGKIYAAEKLLDNVH